jgi:hypothetical protein
MPNAINKRKRNPFTADPDIIETIISTYPIVKDIMERLGMKKLSRQDLMLLMTVENARALSSIESSIKGINDEMRGLREDLRPILEAVAKWIEAQAEKAKSK